MFMFSGLRSPSLAITNTLRSPDNEDRRQDSHQGTQTKTTRGYHSIPIKMAIISLEKKITSVSEDAEKLELLRTVA